MGWIALILGTGTTAMLVGIINMLSAVTKADPAAKEELLHPELVPIQDGQPLLADTGNVFNRVPSLALQLAVLEGEPIPLRLLSARFILSTLVFLPTESIGFAG